MKILQIYFRARLLRPLEISILDLVSMVFQQPCSKVFDERYANALKLPLVKYEASCICYCLPLKSGWFFSVENYRQQLWIPVWNICFLARDCAHNDAFVHQAVHRRAWLCVEGVVCINRRFGSTSYRLRNTSTDLRLSKKVQKSFSFEGVEL